LEKDKVFTPAEDIALALVSDALVATSDPDGVYGPYEGLDKRDQICIRVWYRGAENNCEEVL